MYCFLAESFPIVNHPGMCCIWLQSTPQPHSKFLAHLYFLTNWIHFEHHEFFIFESPPLCTTFFSQHSTVPLNGIGGDLNPWLLRKKMRKRTQELFQSGRTGRATLFGSRRTGSIGPWWTLMWPSTASCGRTGGTRAPTSGSSCCTRRLDSSKAPNK